MDYRIRKIIAYMEANSHEAHRLENMAGMVNLSVSHLQHLFKAETEMCFGQYKKKLKLERARALLVTSFLSGKEICDKVGYGPGHFANDFKTVFGLSPLQYRRKSLAQEETNEQVIV